MLDTITLELRNEDYHEIAMTHLMKVGNDYVDATIANATFADNDYVSCTIEYAPQEMSDAENARWAWILGECKDASEQPGNKKALA